MDIAQRARDALNRRGISTTAYIYGTTGPRKFIWVDAQARGNITVYEDEVLVNQWTGTEYIPLREGIPTHPPSQDLSRIIKDIYPTGTATVQANYRKRDR